MFERDIFTHRAETKCLIDGEIVFYDACSSNSSLAYAKAFYINNFEYIGSGYVYFINGVKNESKTQHHFFKRK